ncbi:unnamed protein product [Caenorhabditis angaria]|uniref:Uncharacterized protein n=1 Tax=Caenorhabditis angaria TaxID=860376 RepID=A0A9P1NCP9_9PELO|nr:unnamed protein product [Caenorhabditis angaria]
METTILKVIFSGFVFLYFYLYYEEIYEFAHLQAYGSNAWLDISQFSNCPKCPDMKNKPNCYSNPSDSSLCGKCFEICFPSKTPSQKEEELAKKRNELAFALAASYNEVNKLLVLVASIHKYFPTTKLLIFDKDNSTLLQNQLISIRNVEVIRFKLPVEIPARRKMRFLTPFYLEESLKRNSKIAWLSVDTEFQNDKYIGFSNNLRKHPVIYTSRDKTRKITSSGYRQYFPTTTVSSNFPLSAILKNDRTLEAIIKWIQKCALTPACWRCRNSKSEAEDCTWTILRLLATSENIFRQLEDSTNTIEKQAWSPPECDIYCTMYLLVVTFTIVVAVGALALLLLKRATKKNHKN